MWSLIQQLLHVDVPVFLCYLACVYLGEAVTPVDISTWVASGKLPFFELVDIAEETLAK